MRIAAQKVNNNGIRVSKSKMLDAVERYSKQYNRTCECLYDLGYLSAPTYFYEDEFWETFFETNKDYITRFLDKHTGAMNYSIPQIEYIMHTIANDSSQDEVYHVFDIVVSLLKAKQAIEDFDKFCNSVKFQKKSDLLVCKTNLSVSNKVYNAGKIPTDSPYVQECFYFDNKKVIKLNYSIVVLKNLLSSLGVDEVLCFDSDSVLLGDDFTVADDCRYINQLINGEIVGNGKYADLLHKTVEKYYDDYYSTRTTIAECIGYAEKNFINSIPSCIEFINQYRERTGNTYKEVYVNSSEVWFQTDEDDEVKSEKPTNIYVGQFLFDFGSRSNLSLINRLLGFSGEYIYEYDNSIVDYDLQGMPVTMYQAGTQKGKIVPIELKYYPILSIKHKDRNNNFEVYPRTKLPERKFMSVSEMLEFLEIDSLDTLDSEVAALIERFYGEHTGTFRKLVGVLVQTLVCMMCDYTLKEHDSPNHIILGSEFSWVTKENYIDACIEAEILFNKLGF